MTLNRHLIHDSHVHRFAVVASSQRGWDVIEEEDSTVLRQIHWEDWHRVERDILRFEIAVFALKRAGWIEHDAAEVLQ